MMWAYGAPLGSFASSWADKDVLACLAILLATACDDGVFQTATADWCCALHLTLDGRRAFAKHLKCSLAACLALQTAEPLRQLVDALNPHITHRRCLFWL